MRSSRLNKSDIASFYFNSLHVQFFFLLILRHFLTLRGCDVLCLSFFFFVDAMVFQLFNPILVYLDLLSTAILFHKVRRYNKPILPFVSQDPIVSLILTLVLLLPYFCLCSVIGMFVNAMHRKMHSTSFSYFLRQFLLLCTKTVPLICLLSLYLASFFNVPQTVHSTDVVAVDELVISIFAFMGLISYYGVTRGLVNFDATMALTCSQSGRVLPRELNISTLLVQHLGYSLYQQSDFSFSHMLRLSYADLSTVLRRLVRYAANCTTGGTCSRIIYILTSLLHKMHQQQHDIITFIIQLFSIGLAGAVLFFVPNLLSLASSAAPPHLQSCSLPQQLCVLFQSMNLEVIVAFLLSFGLDYALVQFLYSLFATIYSGSSLLVLVRLGFWFRILEVLKITRVISLYLDHRHSLSARSVLSVFIRMQLCSITFSRFIVITIQYKMMSDHIFINILTNTHKRLVKHRAIYGLSGFSQLDFKTAHLPRALRTLETAGVMAHISNAASNTIEKYASLFKAFWCLLYSNFFRNWGYSLRQQSQCIFSSQTSDTYLDILDPSHTFLANNIPLFVIEAERFIRVYQAEVNDSSMIQLYKHILEYQESCLTCADSLFLVKSTLETVAIFFNNTVRALLGKVILSDRSKSTAQGATSAHHVINYRSLISAITSSSSAGDTHNGVHLYNSTGANGSSLCKKDASTKESGISHSSLSHQCGNRDKRPANSSLAHAIKDCSLSDPYPTDQIIDSAKVTPATLNRSKRSILRSLDYIKTHPFQVTPRLIHKFTDVYSQSSELASLQTPLMNIDFLDPFDDSHASIGQQTMEESSSLSVTGQKLLEYQQLERALHDLSYPTSTGESLSPFGDRTRKKNSSSELAVSINVQKTAVTFPIPFSQQCSFNSTPTSSCSTPISTPAFFFSNVKPLPHNTLNTLPYPGASRKYRLKELEILNYLAVDDNAALMDPLKDRSLYFALLEDLEKALSTTFFDWVFVFGFTISAGYQEAIYSDVIERASKAQFMLQYARMANSTIRVIPKLFLSLLSSSLGVTLLVARCRKGQSPLVHVIQCDVSLDICPSPSCTSTNTSQISDSIIFSSIASVAILDPQKLLLLCKTMQVFTITLERLQNHYKMHKLASMMYTRKKREKSQYLAYITHCLNCAVVFHSISSRVMAQSQVFSKEQRRLLVSLHRFAELNVYNLEVILSIIRFKTINLDGFTKRIQNCLLSSHDISITLASKGSSWNLFDILDRVLIEQNLALVADLQPIYTIALSNRRWRSPRTCSIQAYSLLSPHNVHYSDERAATGGQSTMELVNYVLYTNVQMTYNFKLAFLIISSLHRYLYAHEVDVHISDGLAERVDSGISNDVVYGSSDLIARYQYASDSSYLKQCSRSRSRSRKGNPVFAGATLTSLATNYLTVDFVIEKIPPQLYDVFAVAICNCWAALCSDMPYIYLQKALGSYLSRRHGGTAPIVRRACSCPAAGATFNFIPNPGTPRSGVYSHNDWSVESMYLLDATKILSHILALKALLFEQCSFSIDDSRIHLRVHMKRAGDPGLSELVLPDMDSCASSMYGEQGVIYTPPHCAEKKLYQQKTTEAPRLTADLNHEGIVGLGRMYPNLLDPVSEETSKSEVSRGYPDMQPSIVSTKFGFVLLNRLPLVTLFTKPARILRAVSSAAASLNMDLLQCASEDELSHSTYPAYVLCQLDIIDDAHGHTSRDDKVILTFKGFMPQTDAETSAMHPIVLKKVTVQTSFYSFCIALGSLLKDFLAAARAGVN